MATAEHTRMVIAEVGDAPEVVRGVRDQLSFDVGEDADTAPDDATFAISGSLVSAEYELPRGALVHVTLSDEDGTIVAEGNGKVATVAFKTHEATPKSPGHVERAHTIKLA